MCTSSKTLEGVGPNKICTVGTIRLPYYLVEIVLKERPF